MKPGRAPRKEEEATNVIWSEAALISGGQGQQSSSLSQAVSPSASSMSRRKDERAGPGVATSPTLTPPPCGRSSSHKHAALRETRQMKRRALLNARARMGAGVPGRGRPAPPSSGLAVQGGRGQLARARMDVPGRDRPARGRDGMAIRGGKGHLRGRHALPDQDVP